MLRVTASVGQRALWSAFLCVSALPWVSGAQAQQAEITERAFSECPELRDDAQRLACFDRFATLAQARDQLLTAESPTLNPDAELPGVRLFGRSSPVELPYLTLHQPNRLIARMDSRDENDLYMDATLSVKAPLLSPMVEELDSILTFSDPENRPRLFFAFNSRFSQYIGTRPSSPVVPRSYNPEMFLRVHDKVQGYWDLGLGHESNGQQINSEAAFNNEVERLRREDLPLFFARDGVSRGWDYVSMDWHRVWGDEFGQADLITHIEWRHFLSNGPFQGAPEEYISWESLGLEPFGQLPRDEFDGLHLRLQYELNWCSQLVCVERIELQQTTGYADLFEHNTSRLMLTANILGLPLHLWGRTGYNNNLIDYAEYSNSWGFGLEFSR